MSNGVPAPAGHWRRTRALYLLLLAFLVPVVASYVAYYLVKPEGRTNYGTLIEPQRPVPNMAAVAIDGAAFDLRALKGKWIFVIADTGACDARCEAKLLHMRQQRTMTGKEMEAIERVWFVTDNKPLEARLSTEYAGTHIARVDERVLKEFLPLPAGADADLRDHIWIVDPFGNLMMRWPKNPDPNGTKGDMDRLLKAASLWTRVERGEKP
jgi:hypothetical protein